MLICNAAISRLLLKGGFWSLKNEFYFLTNKLVKNTREGKYSTVSLSRKGEWKDTP